MTLWRTYCAWLSWPMAAVLVALSLVVLVAPATPAAEIVVAEPTGLAINWSALAQSLVMGLVTVALAAPGITWRLSRFIDEREAIYRSCEHAHDSAEEHALFIARAPERRTRRGTR